MKDNTVKERDLGWDRIQKELAEAKDAAVNVGVPSDAGEHEDGTSLLVIAAANEFGTSDGRIPSRPFIRGAFQQHQRDLYQYSERLWNLILQGKMTTHRALGLMGERHQGEIRNYMTALSSPPNAPATVAKKGSANPLIDEGILRRSIVWERE
ncbi:MAG: hypothetical protein FKY71_08290 [Spiribacter salinus]|uniref:Uncharacterized protein n=1 Tax=Spiribacter salinus TaxID=1335746 RepID=A0A540VRW3_9GAMM|nr:MAG: hypothetical protein FKY71_08290 [Spiribacter salinus]